MASATTRPTFSFLHHHNLHPSKPCKLHLPIPKPPLTTTTNTPSLSLKTSKLITPHSLNLSQDDKPLSQDSNNSNNNQEEDQPQQQEKEEEEEEDLLLLQETPNIDPRRLEEKFVVLNTGVYECRSCGYCYNEATGDPSYPIPPGLPFEQLPEDWRCATCGAAKSFFQSKSVEIAGFAQNQQFGLGGNTLTSGQKALLIYGSLLFGFVLFLSGYFLQ